MPTTDEKFSLLQHALGKHLPALDGLRGIAIILVVWHNVTAGNYAGGALSRVVNLLANMGWVGVQLFFVLSGFLITGILLDGKGSPRQLRNFFLRRILRIFPLYYAVLFLSFVFLPQLGMAPIWLQQDQKDQLWYWTYLINWAAPFLDGRRAFGHFWSLAVEEQFYVLWPLCVAFFSPRKLGYFCLMLVVIALVFRAALTALDPVLAQKAAYTFTVARWDALAVGALVALVVRNQNAYRLAESSIPVVFWLLAGYIATFVISFRNFSPVIEGAGFLNQTVIAGLFGILLLAAIRPSMPNNKRWFQQFLAGRFLRFSGKYSYAIYVFHLPLEILTAPLWSKYLAGLAAYGPLLGETLRAGAVFMLASVISVISWQLLERPCLRLKRYFPAAKISAA